MASSNQTLSDSGSEFEADGTQRIATLNVPGGRVTNTGTVAAAINVDAGAVLVTQPCGASGRLVAVGDTVVLPDQCAAFTFKSTGASTWLLYSRR